jgi:hypothetical protein
MMTELLVKFLNADQVVCLRFLDVLRYNMVIQLSLYAHFQNSTHRSKLIIKVSIINE